MTAASAFTLVGGAFELYANRDAGSAVLLVGSGVVAGALFLALAEGRIPHEHFLKGSEGRQARFARGAWLFVVAIALHNLPEGFAVGVGFAAPETAIGFTIAAGIVIQNLPEGLIAAASLAVVGYSRRRAVAIAAATGLAETGGGIVGWLAGSLLEALVPLTLAFAAGAMLYVVGQEVIPESQRQGRARIATWGWMSGFVLMTALDRLIG
jgi:ZIP family zinc transporter